MKSYKRSGKRIYQRRSESTVKVKIKLNSRLASLSFLTKWYCGGKGGCKDEMENNDKKDKNLSYLVFSLKYFIWLGIVRLGLQGRT